MDNLSFNIDIIKSFSELRLLSYDNQINTLKNIFNVITSLQFIADDIVKYPKIQKIPNYKNIIRDNLILLNGALREKDNNIFINSCSNVLELAFTVTLKEYITNEQVIEGIKKYRHYPNYFTNQDEKTIVKIIEFYNLSKIIYYLNFIEQGKLSYSKEDYPQIGINQSIPFALDIFCKRRGGVEEFIDTSSINEVYGRPFFHKLDRKYPQAINENTLPETYGLINYYLTYNVEDDQVLQCADVDIGDRKPIWETTSSENRINDLEILDSTWYSIIYCKYCVGEFTLEDTIIDYDKLLEIHKFIYTIKLKGYDGIPNFAVNEYSSDIREEVKFYIENYFYIIGGMLDKFTENYEGDKKEIIVQYPKNFLEFWTTSVSEREYGEEQKFTIPAFNDQFQKIIDKCEKFQKIPKEIIQNNAYYNPYSNVRLRSSGGAQLVYDYATGTLNAWYRCSGAGMFGGSGINSNIIDNIMTRITRPYQGDVDMVQWINEVYQYSPSARRHLEQRWNYQPGMIGGSKKVKKYYKKTKKNNKNKKTKKKKIKKKMI